MSSTEAPDSNREHQLLAWRLALAALEAERARLIAKYDRRIAALRDAIQTLERGPTAGRGRSGPPSEPKPARKPKKPAS